MFDSFKSTESLIPTDRDLVFDTTGEGGRSGTVLLPYIEQHRGEADNRGIVIDWASGDGSKGWDSVGVIAIIAPPEHEGRSVLEFSVENFPNNSSQGGPGESTGKVTIGDAGLFPTETIHAAYSIHSLYDLVV